MLAWHARSKESMENPGDRCQIGMSITNVWMELLLLQMHWLLMRQDLVSVQ